MDDFMWMEVDEVDEVDEEEEHESVCVDCVECELDEMCDIDDYHDVDFLLEARSRSDPGVGPPPVVRQRAYTAEDWIAGVRVLGRIV